MRFYQPKAEFCCGIDLHSRSMYLCMIDKSGTIVVHRNLRTDAAAFLKVIAPYRSSLVVTVESVSNWYWLGDLCRAEGIDFVLGHAPYMRAIHGAKTKNDKIDSEKIARLTQGGLLPMAYVCPPERRGLRDLLRRRLRFVRLRAELYGHVRTLYRQANLSTSAGQVKKPRQRAALAECFDDAAVQGNVAADVELMSHFDDTIRDLEAKIRQAAAGVLAKELAVLQSIKGVGPITSLTILLEINSLERFATRQCFCSYSRLVAPRQESGGKQYGSSGRKIGNMYLKWAFSEAAVHVALFNPRIGKYLSQLASKHGPGKSKALLAHKLGRAMYHMLKRGQVFDLDKFLRG